VSGERSVLVTGGAGFIGGHLVEHLLERGRRVRVLVRPGTDARRLPADVERVVGDLTRPLSLLPAVRGAGIVYHLAGVLAAFRPEGFRDVNVTGTRNLVLACRKASPDLSRFVLVSSLAAVGPCRDGRPVAESDTPRPVSRYGASKLEAERTAVAAAGEIPVTVVRPPVVYGPRDRATVPLLRLVSRGFRPSFLRRKYVPLVHVRDLARGIRRAGERPVAAGRTYHVGGSRIRSVDAVLRRIAGAMGVRARSLPVPLGLLRLLGAMSDGLAPSAGHRRPPVSDKLRELGPDVWAADTARALRELGFTEEVPLSRGVDETVEWFAASRAGALDGIE
jgi:nucleoside-diphosphate-sugar epimerase